MRSCDATFRFNLKRNPVRRIFLLGSASFCVVVFELTLFALTFFLKKISDIRRLARPTEAGCQTIIASGDSRMEKCTKARPASWRVQYICIREITISKIVLHLTSPRSFEFYPLPGFAGLLLFDLRCRSGEIPYVNFRRKQQRAT